MIEAFVKKLLEILGIQKPAYATVPINGTKTQQ